MACAPGRSSARTPSSPDSWRSTLGALPRLASHFERNDVEEGSGLGMSLVYKFIEAMGWQIEVESAPGQGTRIQVLLPLHEA